MSHYLLTFIINFTSLGLYTQKQREQCKTRTCRLAVDLSNGKKKCFHSLLKFQCNGINVHHCIGRTEDIVWKCVLVLFCLYYYQNTCTCKIYVKPVSSTTNGCFVKNMVFINNRHDIYGKYYNDEVYLQSFIVCF